MKAGVILAVDAPAFELVAWRAISRQRARAEVAQAVEDEISVALDALIRVPLEDHI